MNVEKGKCKFMAALCVRSIPKLQKRIFFDFLTEFEAKKKFGENRFESIWRIRYAQTSISLSLSFYRDRSAGKEFSIGKLVHAIFNSHLFNLSLSLSATLSLSLSLFLFLLSHTHTHTCIVHLSWQRRRRMEKNRRSLSQVTVPGLITNQSGKQLVFIANGVWLVAWFGFFGFFFSAHGSKR
jgi:hypothetical protein